MVLYWFVGILLLELIAIYLLFDCDMLNPSFLFCAGFLFSALDLLTMVEKWSIEMHWNTVGLVCGSILVFAICSFAVQKNKLRVKDKSFGLYPKYDIAWIVKKRRIYLRFFTMYNVVAFTASLLIILVSARSLGLSGSLLYLLGAVGDMGKFTTTGISYGPIFTIFSLVSRYGGLMCGVLMVTIYQQQKKINKLLLINYAFSLLFYFLSGSRGDAFLSVLAMLHAAVMSLRASSRRKKLHPKYLLGGIVLIGALLFCFDALGRAMKRITADYSFWEYISIYLGAPLLNLDSFLQTQISTSDLWGSNTFYNVYSWLGTNFGKEEYIFVRNLPFRFVNGRTLGNVYTTFYAWISDFNTCGSIILTGIMAIISNKVYMQACRDTRNGYLSLSRVALWIIIPTIPLSFFGNRFYAAIINFDFLYGMIVIALLFNLIGKVRLKLEYRKKKEAYS